MTLDVIFTGPPNDDFSPDLATHLSRPNAPNCRRRTPDNPSARLHRPSAMAGIGQYDESEAA